MIDKNGLNRERRKIYNALDKAALRIEQMVENVDNYRTGTKYTSDALEQIMKVKDKIALYYHYQKKEIIKNQKMQKRVRI